MSVTVLQVPYCKSATLKNLGSVIYENVFANYSYSFLVGSKVNSVCKTKFCCKCLYLRNWCIVNLSKSDDCLLISSRHEECIRRLFVF
jgi:hypothetical protein